jgi:hypothetical protein
MTTTSTAVDALADRDPDVPGLRLLMDGEQLGAWLADHGPFDKFREPFGLVPNYLRYKPGTSLIAGFATTAGPVFGYAVSRDAEPKLGKLVRTAPPGSVLAHDRRLRLVLARPAADRDLPGLRTELAAAAEPLAYKPQRRLVGGLPDRILRCYRPADAEGIISRWPSPGAVSSIRTPQVVEADRAAGWVLIDRLPGQRLDGLTGTDLRDGLTAAGAAIGRWHRQAPTVSRPADLPDLTATAEQLARLLPEQAARIAELAAAVGEPSGEVDHGSCHGDFSADQVLIEGETAGISLLDWDRSGHGPLAADLANADAAGLEQITELGDDGWQALLTGYAAERELPAGLDRWRARARFARSIDPFRMAGREWPRAVRAHLDRVEELLP